MNLIEPILADAAAITAIRRDIHAHPELCFEEQRTADVIAKALTDWGIPDPPRPGQDRRGGHRQERHAASRAVGLRADIDALPMTEHNTFAHASQHPGKMHACGHDGHTAMLLAAAKHLAKHRNFDGTVYLVFQPAEEGGGGAREMIKDGLFEQFPMEAMFGAHNWPGMPVGTVRASTPAPVMAIEQRVQDHHPRQGQPRGAAAHWASTRCRWPARWCRPSRPSSRATSKPIDAGVISVTMIHAGEATNVMPDSCELRGTVRTFTHRDAGPDRAAHAARWPSTPAPPSAPPASSSSRATTRRRSTTRPRPSSCARVLAGVVGAEQRGAPSSRPWAPRTSASSCRPSRAATSSSATATAATAKAATAWGRACCTTPATTSTTS